MVFQHAKFHLVLYILSPLWSKKRDFTKFFSTGLLYPGSPDKHGNYHPTLRKLAKSSATYYITSELTVITCVISHQYITSSSTHP